MARRFYCPGPWPSTPWALPLAEAHHVRDVLRQTPGDEIILFDGVGVEAVAEIVAVTPQSVLVQIQQMRNSVPLTPGSLTVAVAFPKGDRSKWLIEKLTELGVTRCVPLVTERTIVDPGVGKLDKLRHTIVEASKQCRRNDLLELLPPVEFKQFWATVPPETVCWMAAPGGMTLSPSDFASSGDHVVLIGPEGGFSPAEVELARNQQTRLIGLGANILRIETAAVVVASLWSLRLPHDAAP